MPDRYQPLRDAIAAGPTKGPWALKRHTCNADGSHDARDDWTVYGPEGESICFEGSSPRLHDPDFIAAADPDTITALLKERDALREALSELVTCHAGGGFVEPDPSVMNAARAALADGEWSVRAHSVPEIEGGCLPRKW